MYQVLARKYRPQTFADVIGQEHITRTLMNALSMGRIHHAYLFAGARGIGKTTVARILAKALNCERGPNTEPCGKCNQCEDITEGTSLDVQEIDGASNTGVDDVREIREKARYLPSSGRYKIYIIDEVHMLSTSAFNALLKTLEEPPPHVVFIFATTESQKIPATILSRCQRYDFRRIPSTKIVSSLKAIANSEGITADDEALTLIAHEASGSLRDGQSLLDQAIAYSGKHVSAQSLQELLGFLDKQLILNLLEAIVTRDAKKSLELLDEIYQMGSSLTQLATSLLEMLKDMLVIKVAGKVDASADLSASEADRLTKLAANTEMEVCERMFQIWYIGAEQIARSPFPKMLTETFVIRLCTVTPVAPISDIVARLDSFLGSTDQHTKRQPSISATGEPPRETVKRTTSAAGGAATQPSGSIDWEAFMRWLVTEKPQVASVFHHGKLKRSDSSSIEIEFDAPIYAEMVMEADRKKQIDALLEKYFKRPMKISVTSTKNNNTKPAAQKRQQATKEALESNLVQQATEIFDAKIHDVKTKN